MSGGPVCLTDHGYFYPKPLRPGRRHFDVLAPADGRVVTIAHRMRIAGSIERPRDCNDHALPVEHTPAFGSAANTCER